LLKLTLYHLMTNGNAIIEIHNDDELFTKKKYNWTGTTSLGSYFISATSSHYDWGFGTIKPLKKMAN